MQRLGRALGAATNTARPSRQSLVRLALDLVLVHYSLRTATLIDSFAPSVRECHAIAAALQQENMDLLLVLFAPSQQVLAINRKRMRHMWEHDIVRVYVDVSPARDKKDRTFPQSTTIPQGARAILTPIYHACAERESVVLLSADAPSDARCCMIAAVGWLLDYPVIYMLGDAHPSIVTKTADTWEDEDWSNLTSDLVDVMLHRIEAQLHLPPALAQVLHIPNHQVLAFSIPCNLADVQHLIYQATCTVHRRLSHDLQSSLFANETHISIQKAQVYMDRVAL